MQQLSDMHLLQDLSGSVENRTGRTFNKEYEKDKFSLKLLKALLYLLYFENYTFDWDCFTQKYGNVS